MIRRMVTRLVVAKLMHVAVKTGQNAFRNRKTARVQDKGQSGRLNQPSHEGHTEKSDVTDTP